LESNNSYSIKYVWDKLKLPKPAGAKSWMDVLYNGEYNTIGDIIVSCRQKFENGIYSLSDCLITFSNIVLDFIRDAELDKQAREDFPKLEKLIAEYTTIQEYLLSFAIDKEKYVDFYKRDLDVDCENPNEENFVTISTIHSAKGLEWDNVIIPGMSEGIFPNPYFCDDKHSAEKTQENYNDELKNLFVAVTRTKKNLYMTYPTVKIVKKGMNVYRFDMSKSRFIKDLPNN
jgi:superfamily I DNA/RNA helicase